MRVMTAQSAREALDQLQIVVLCEVEDKAVGHGLHVIQSAVNENGFLALVIPWTHEGRIAHSLFGTEGRENTAQPLGPVARPKLPAFDCQADDEERRVR